MDIYDDELVNLWKLLAKHQVSYIMVGGFATNLHGFSRITADADIWIEDSLENRKRFREAIKDLGIGDFSQFETIEFIAGYSSISLDSGIELDIMTQLKDFGKEQFSECFKLASTAEIFGISVPFLHLNHLLREKKATGRPKDLLDIEELKKANNIQ
jgi:hypothetical protein